MSLDYINADVDSLMSRVKSLEARIALLESLERYVTELRTEVSSLRCSLSTVKSTSVYQSRLLWHLDAGNRRSKFIDLTVRPDSEEELEHVRDIIRPALVDHGRSAATLILTGS